MVTTSGDTRIPEQMSPEPHAGASAMDELRKLVLDAGYYVSKRNFFEPRW